MVRKLVIETVRLTNSANVSSFGLHLSGQAFDSLLPAFHYENDWLLDYSHPHDGGGVNVITLFFLFFRGLPVAVVALILGALESATGVYRTLITSLASFAPLVDFVAREGVAGEETGNRHPISLGRVLI
jgi:hypothetical protein